MNVVQNAARNLRLNDLYRQVRPLLTTDQRKRVTGHDMLAALRQPDPVSVILSTSQGTNKMNKDRRSRLSAAVAKLHEALSEIEEIRDEEQEAFDNMPESIQQGDKGTTMEEGLDTLGEAHEAIEEAANNLEELASA